MRTSLKNLIMTSLPADACQYLMECRCKASAGAPGSPERSTKPVADSMKAGSTPAVTVSAILYNILCKSKGEMRCELRSKSLMLAGRTYNSQCSPPPVGNKYTLAYQTLHFARTVDLQHCIPNLQHAESRPVDVQLGTADEAGPMKYKRENEEKRAIMMCIVPQP